MTVRQFLVLGWAMLIFASGTAPAYAQDADLCFSTADLLKEGAQVPDKDRTAAHEACQRALSDTSSIIQKYHLQEADFDVTGTRPKP